MKNKLTLIFSFLCTAYSMNSNAQHLHVIGAAVNFTETGTHSVAWTIGEVLTTTMTSTSNEITQGFHQANLYVTEVVSYDKLNIEVYPNPARDVINIVSDLPSKMSIFNAQGKLIDIIDITDISTSMNLSYLSRGSYLLVFNANGVVAKQMKIVLL